MRGKSHNFLFSLSSRQVMSDEANKKLRVLMSSENKLEESEREVTRLKAELDKSQGEVARLRGVLRQVVSV